MGYACTYMHVLVCVRAHRFSTWIALFQQKVIYESEFNKHVRMIYAHTHTHTNVCKFVCVCAYADAKVCGIQCPVYIYVCMYVCVSGIYVCTNIRILIINWVRCCCCQTQHTATHNTQPIATQHNTTQQNKTKRTATRSDPYAVWHVCLEWKLTYNWFSFRALLTEVRSHCACAAASPSAATATADCPLPTDNRPPTRPRTQRRRHR